MKAFKDWSVKKKIFSLVLLFQTLSLILALVISYGLIQIGTQIDSVKYSHTEIQRKISSLKNSFSFTRVFSVKAASSTNEGEYAKYQKFAQENLQTSILNSKDILEKLNSSISLKAECSDCKTIQKSFQNTSTKFIEIYSAIQKDLKSIDPKNTGKLQEIKAQLVSYNDLQMELLQSLEKLEQMEEKDILQKFDTLKKMQYVGILIIISAFILAFVVSSLVSFYIINLIVKPLKEAQLVAARFSEGDFTFRTNEYTKDETGILIYSLTKAAENLRILVNEIGNHAGSVAFSADALRNSAEALSNGAINQATALNHTKSATNHTAESITHVSESSSTQSEESNQSFSSMLELSNSIEIVAGETEQVRDGAFTVLRLAEDGQEKVNDSVIKMDAIQKSSSQISEIVTVINEISDQTNLLALNASIEAARAGEFGRGFAVVASEISKLANRSNEATKQIEKLIKDSIQKVQQGQGTVKGVEEAFRQILLNSKLTAEKSQKISSETSNQNEKSSKVLKSIQKLTNISLLISDSTFEQKEAVGDINKSIEEINAIAQENAEQSRAMVQEIQALTELSEKLNSLIGNFTIY